MKRNIYIIILGILFVFPVSTYALTTNNTVTCTPLKINSGETVTCTFRSNITSGKLTGFSAKYNLSEGVTYENNSFQFGSAMTPLAANNIGFNSINPSGVNGNIILGTANFKINGNSGNYTINLKNIDMSDENLSSKDGTSTGATVKIKSSDNTLKSLSISPVNYSDSKITNIVKNDNIVSSATVDGSMINIKAETNDSNATVTGIGNNKIKYGKNDFKIKVTAENGTTKIYTLIITRTVMRGDVTLDEMINIADAVAIAKFIIGDISLSDNQLNVSDYNNDGKVNIADAVAIAIKIIN